MKNSVMLVSLLLLNMYTEDDTLNVETFWDKDEF
jgi:hypothetical protein